MPDGETMLLVDPTRFGCLLGRLASEMSSEVLEEDIPPVSGELGRVGVVVKGGSDGFEVDRLEVGWGDEGLEDDASDCGGTLVDG